MVGARYKNVFADGSSAKTISGKTIEGSFASAAAYRTAAAAEKRRLAAPSTRLVRISGTSRATSF
jgi:hypothetical protein